ncbi:MAG: hypothetical protein ABEJ87_03900 [Candidatus Nanohalobium sp.]
MSASKPLELEARAENGSGDIEVVTAEMENVLAVLGSEWGAKDELVDNYAVDNALDPDAMAEAYGGDGAVSVEGYDEQEDGDLSYEFDVDDVLEDDGSLTPAEKL